MDGSRCRWLARLPLAQAMLRLWMYLAENRFFQEVYERNRGRCYERQLDFPLVLDLMADAMMQYRGYLNRSLEHARLLKRLPASKQAAYGKLGRMPLELSCALLEEGTRRLQDLLPRLPLWRAPRCLRGMMPVLIDGKKIKFVAKRLKLTRGRSGALLGGKILVAFDPVSNLALAMSASPDGEANDVPLVPDLLAQLPAGGQRVLLCILDRQFCNRTVPAQVLGCGHHFLVRYARSIGFYPDPSRPSQQGIDARGRRYTQEWGWLGQGEGRLYVRRIAVAGALAVVTDLLEERPYPAADLLEAYAERRAIEGVFQKIVEVFHLETLIGCTPEATVFQAAFCLLLYNMMHVLGAHVAQAQHEAVERISVENLFGDVCRQMIVCCEEAGLTLATLRMGTMADAKEVRRELARLLHDEWRPWWRKAKKKKPPRPAPKPKGQSGEHTSVFRILHPPPRPPRRRRPVPKHAQRP